MDAIQNILVVRLGAWGDTVLSAFVPGALRRQFPKARVTLLTGKAMSDWSNCLDYDHVLVVDEKLLYSEKTSKAMYGLATAAAQIRLKGKFDLGLSLHRTWQFGALLKLGGVAKAVGLVRAGAQPPSWLPKALHFDQVVMMKKESEIERYISLLKAIGVDDPGLNFRLKLRDSVQRAVATKLLESGLHPKQYLVVAPGGGENIKTRFLHKRWPYFKEFLRTSLDEQHLPVVLLGGPDEKNLAAPLKEAFDPHFHKFFSRNPIHDWIGRTSREEALAVISMAKGYVGCDSGLSHVAGAVGVPAVVLYGPTDARSWQPPGAGRSVKCLDGRVPCSPCYNDDGNFNWKCPDNVCMKAISPGQVIEALEKVLD